MKVIITGVPRSGKTTAANRLATSGAVVRHTDDLVGSHDWSDTSEQVSRWFDDAGPLVIEGVAALRALRKWLRAHPTGRPADTVYYANAPLVNLTPGQRRMASGCHTIWDEVLPELQRRGVTVHMGPLP